MYGITIHLPNDKNIDEIELISVIKNHCDKLKVIKSFELENSNLIDNFKKNIIYSLDLQLPNISTEKIDIIQTILKTRYHIEPITGSNHVSCISCM
tara:strand:+ start:7118 stop:7405 length:288 start_codon:yes stop_codon:yes gene_type:complete